MKADEEIKEDAVRLSDEMVPKKAAEQLGLPYYTLQEWIENGNFIPKNCKYIK